MKHLLRKELRLTLHPTAILFLALSALMLVPGYPYLVTFFYTGLGVFFICLNGREQHDVFYTMSLPISRQQAVQARFSIVIALQLAQLLLAIPFAWLRQRIGIPANPVGMEANVALFGFAFLLLGVFNGSFFRVYYRNVNRVGAAMAWSSLAVGGVILATETCTHAVPFCRDRLDTFDPAYLPEKLVVLAAGFVCYLLLTAAAYRRAQRDFAQQDL